MPRKESHEPPVVVAKAYDFTLWLLPKAEKFSRSYRFSVGDSAGGKLLDLLLCCCSWRLLLPADPAS